MKLSDRKCYIIDICVCLDAWPTAMLDVNIEKKIQLKLDNYLPLKSELKRLYNDYSFEIIPIVIGAIGLITLNITNALETIGIKKVTEVISQCQKCEH